MATAKLTYQVNVGYEKEAEKELATIEGVEFIGPLTLKVTAPSFDDLKRKLAFQVRRVNGLASTTVFDVEN